MYALRLAEIITVWLENLADWPLNNELFIFADLNLAVVSRYHTPCPRATPTSVLQLLLLWFQLFVLDSVLIESRVRGHHIYKDIWTPHLGQELVCRRQLDNEHDQQ